MISKLTNQNAGEKNEESKIDVFVWGLFNHISAYFKLMWIMFYQ